MTRLFLASLLVAVSLGNAVGAGKTPDVQIVEVMARRSGDRIIIDGRIRGERKKPIPGVVLLFDFLAPGGAVITTQEYSTGEDVLARADELPFNVQLRDEARAVKYRVNATDGQGNELRVAGGGPFPIE